MHVIVLVWECTQHPIHCVRLTFGDACCDPCWAFISLSICFFSCFMRLFISARSGKWISSHWRQTPPSYRSTGRGASKQNSSASQWRVINTSCLFLRHWLLTSSRNPPHCLVAMTHGWLHHRCRSILAYCSSHRRARYTHGRQVKMHMIMRTTLWIHIYSCKYALCCEWSLPLIN